VIVDRDQHSRTSLWTAYQRAWHAQHDAPTIFEDGLAGRLVDGLMKELIAPVQQFAGALTLPRAARASLPEAVRQLLELACRLDPAGADPFPDTLAATRWIMRALLPTSHVVGRARFAEDSLAAAARRGVGQYVVLGAGMDTFAFRRPAELARTRVIEVDHPATQSFKRRRIAELGWEVPADVQFLPVNLAAGGLATALASASFDSGSPAFFSWLGVTQYLRRDALRATLRAIADVGAPGSSVVFDYYRPGMFEATNPHRPFVVQEAERLGEKMPGGIEPAELADVLGGAGLVLEEDLGPEEIQARWFSGRRDGLRALPFAHLARVAVGPRR
jgi:methyltransferase (TIGR00027 family)